MERLEAIVEASFFDEQKNSARPLPKPVIRGVKDRPVEYAISMAIVLRSMVSSNQAHITTFCHLR